MSPFRFPSFRPKQWGPKAWCGVLWGLFLGFWAGLLLFLASIEGNWFNLYGQMPKPQRLKNPQHNIASELYSADSVLIGRYYQENRSPVPFQQISPHVKAALVATEDIRFFEHSGIDGPALLSVAFSFLSGDARGGSTISQQLAKNLYSTRDLAHGLLDELATTRLFIAKLKEWITAVKLERRYTKQEILTMYLNTVDFGSNAFGIKTAARTYFSTSPDSLKAEEAAVLVGLLKATTAYNPRRHPEASRRRRNVVLHNMARYRFIGEKQADSLADLPLVLDFQQVSHYDGAATYFRGAISGILKKWCKRNGYDLYRDGLKIYTTLNWRMQQEAEAAVAEMMAQNQQRFFEHWRGQKPWRTQNGRLIENYLKQEIRKTPAYQRFAKKYGPDSEKLWQALRKKRQMTVFSHDGPVDTTLSHLDSLAYYKHFLHCGLMSMEPKTGHIKTWVGGIDFRYFQYDNVRQAKRQPGSTFKAIVYGAAIGEGYSPCYRIMDSVYTYRYQEKEDGEWKNKRWTPHNANWITSGKPMTLRHAMGRSINTVTAQLAHRVGEPTIAQYAHRMGINSQLDTTPSMCLGANELSLYELVGAYATYFNSGTWTEPMVITRIEDRQGNTLTEPKPKRRKVFSRQEAFLMRHMLKGTFEEPQGTSLGLYRYPDLVRGNDIAGKTGTSSGYRDAWYMGIVPGLVTGVWVGGQDPSIHFRNSMGEGAKLALPVYGRYMERLYNRPGIPLEKGQFEQPQGPIRRKWDCPTPEPVLPDSLMEKDSLELAEIEAETPDSMDRRRQQSDSLP